MEEIKFELGIYEHYKKGHLYRAILVSYDHETGEPQVSYYRCNEHGIFQSIRELGIDENGNDVETIVNQPFTRSLKEFTQEMTLNLDKYTFVRKRFKFIK